MASIGDFGTYRPLVRDTFGWFGTEIGINPSLTDLVLMDFAEYAQSLDENSPEAMTFMKRQMKLVVAPEDFDAFWQGALDNGQDSTDLMAVMKAVVETKAKRPTVQPSGSSDGQARAVATSPDVSSSPATAVSPLTEMDRRAIENESGRPDVAMTIWEAAKHRQMERQAG
jgi:hypothetical protein